MRLVSSIVTLVLAPMVVSCAPAPRTQIMVVLDADDALRAEIGVVRIEVLGGARGEQVASRYDGLETIERWPLDVAIVPFDRDATREVRLLATGLASAEGATLATVRIDTAFVRGRTLRLDARFESACRGVVCEGATTCRGGVCERSEIDPGLLPDLVVDAGPGDVGPVPHDGGPDAYAPPDAWTQPVRGEGEPCDPAAITSRCAPNLACTCTGAMGCAGAEPPRCWAMSDISCARPIDLTALAPSLAPGEEIEVELDGTGAPDLVGGTCGEASGELVYLFRVTEPMQLLVEADVPYEYWPDCRSGWSWGTVLCNAAEVFLATPTYPAFVFVETAGVHRVRIRRTS